MSTVSGRYVRTFAQADMGMLDGVSLNAPYPFFWLHLKRIDGEHIVCTGGGEEMRLRYWSTPRGERAAVTIQDPLFGPQKFPVHPFLQDSGSPIGPQQPKLGLG